MPRQSVKARAETTWTCIISCEQVKGNNFVWGRTKSCLHSIHQGELRTSEVQVTMKKGVWTKTVFPAGFVHNKGVNYINYITIGVNYITKFPSFPFKTTQLFALNILRELKKGSQGTKIRTLKHRKRPPQPGPGEHQDSSSFLQVLTLVGAATEWSVEPVKIN